MNTRRKFLKTVGLSTIVISAKPTTLLKTKLTKNTTHNFAFSCPAYIQNGIEDQLTIISITNKPALCWVEILDESGRVKNKIYQSEDGMIEANTTLFKFKVKGAVPGKKIRYQVKAKEVVKFEPYNIEYDAEIESPIYTTSTLFKESKNITCIIYNDVHEDTDTYEELLEHVDKNFDFAILNGDSFHHVNTEEDISNKMLSKLSSLYATDKMFIMNRGNHETRGAFARRFKNYFDYPQNKFYQAFRLGPIFWILLDGGEDKPDTHEVYASTVDYDNYRLEQGAWLKKIVETEDFKKSPFKIVVNHIPAFHSDDWHGTLHNRQVFHPILQKAEIDAVISGHTHRYGFYDKDEEHNYPIFIGGGPKKGNRTIIEVKANLEYLSIKMIRDDGSIVKNLQKQI